MSEVATTYRPEQLVYGRVAKPGVFKEVSPGLGVEIAAPGELSECMVFVRLAPWAYEALQSAAEGRNLQPCDSQPSARKGGGPTQCQPRSAVAT